MLRFQCSRDVEIRNCVFDCDINTQNRGCMDLYIANYAAVDKSLLIGGYQTSDGIKGRFWDGTVYFCKIYDKLLTEEQINKIMAG